MKNYVTVSALIAVLVSLGACTSADRFGAFRFAGLGPGRHELVVTAWKNDTDIRTVRNTVDLGVDSGEQIILVDRQ